MAANTGDLTKGQARKRGSLRKLIGDELGDEVFARWLEREARSKQENLSDPVAEMITNALSDLANDKTFRLGNYGYTVRRARGHNASGFLITRNHKP